MIRLIQIWLHGNPGVVSLHHDVCCPCSMGRPVKAQLLSDPPPQLLLVRSAGRRGRGRPGRGSARHEVRAKREGRPGDSS